MRLFYDLETNGLLDVENPTIHCIVIGDVETGVRTRYRSDDPVNTIDAAISLLGEAEEIVGHNVIGFDNKFIQLLYPAFTPKKVTDTLVISRLIWTNLKEVDAKKRAKNLQYLPGQLTGRHSLEAWGHRLGFHKGDYKAEMKALGLDPWAEINDRMVDYCDNDVALTAKLWDVIVARNYSQQAIELEHAVWVHCLAQMDFGCSFDEHKAQELCATLSGERSTLERDLKAAFGVWWAPRKRRAIDGQPATSGWKRSARRFVVDQRGAQSRLSPRTKAKPVREKQTGWYEINEKGAYFTPVELREFNPSSRDQIGDRLIQKYGWKPKKFTDTGKPVVDEETMAGLKYPESKLLNRFLLVDKRLGQISEGKEAWLKVVRGGRIYGRIDTNAAITGRATHSKPNLGQVPKVGSPYGEECRSMFRATPSLFPFFVGADGSGLELRCLAHYMAFYDGGVYAVSVLSDDKANDKDVHSVNTLALGLKPKELYTLGGKTGKGRDFGKTFIYAFLYGAGDALIGAIIGKGRKAGTELKAAFLRGLPALGKLIDAVKKNAKKGWLRGLDGREIIVRSEHAALNTLLQGAGAVIMKQAMKNWHEMMADKGYVHGVDYRQILWVHDEFQAECRTYDISVVCGETMVEAIRKVTTDFNFRCPLDGEYKLGINWAETH